MTSERLLNMCIGRFIPPQKIYTQNKFLATPLKIIRIQISPLMSHHVSAHSTFNRHGHYIRQLLMANNSALSRELTMNARLLASISVFVVDATDCCSLAPPTTPAQRRRRPCQVI